MINTASLRKFNVDEIRKDFPVLAKQINGKPLIYFDNGATAQKPLQVIDAITRFYKEQNSNIHRGVHTLSREITALYEDARQTVKEFMNAKHLHEVIFTKGTTDGINLVSHCFGKLFVQEGDEVLITEMEHHSNIIPWQILCEEKKLKLKVIPINENGEIVQEEFERLLNPKTKLLAVTHISNTLGTINPIKEMIARAHDLNIPVLVDGAQAVPHEKVDVQELDCDFYVFSGHKMFGPTGVGILYGKEKWLNVFPPYQGGGGIIKTVSFEKTEYADSPLRFEAGTPHIEGGIGLAAAIQYIGKIGYENIQLHEAKLLQHATDGLIKIPGLKIIGNAEHKASVISFVVEGIHSYDLGMMLDALGVAVRTGHHCTQPIMQHYNIQGTIRASFAFYNTLEEIDQFIAALLRCIQRLK